jgi:hypothetical protein
MGFRKGDQPAAQQTAADQIKVEDAGRRHFA